MKNSDFVSHSLTRQEKSFGALWMAFETLLFATILQGLNHLLPAPLPQVEVNFIFFSINFVTVVFIFRNYFSAQIKLLPDVIERVLLVTAPGFLAYRLVSFLLALALFAVDSDFASINDITIQSLVKDNYFLMFVGSVILVPITEECLFRGLVFRGMYDRSPIFAWILSVALFSAVHIITYIGAYPVRTILLCFVQYIPAGVCLAGAYRLSGSLLSPILIHALVNFVGMMSLR